MTDSNSHEDGAEEIRQIKAICELRTCACITMDTADARRSRTRIYKVVRKIVQSQNS